ncbi:hypothetical protein [Sulfurimonas sp.]|uniref:hypothetical protein n=1 Tax=Sulfurimonas sp. TaxID=2022749 RepID=UPI00260F05EC|nr:hypothetical protein [Sulfurimonas sp.]
MSTIEKIKRTVLIALGFALATYLILSGTAILNKKELFVQKIQNVPSISYIELAKKILPLTQEDMYKDEFQFRYDTNETAINFEKTTQEQIVVLTQKYGVIMYDVDTAKFALLFDTNARLMGVALLEISNGNNEWKMQRETKIKPSKNILFLVSDKYYNTEWTIPYVKGKSVLSEKNVYVINVTKNLHFSVEPREDKELQEQLSRN